MKNLSTLFFLALLITTVSQAQHQQPLPVLFIDAHKVVLFGKHPENGCRSLEAIALSELYEKIQKTPEDAKEHARREWSIQEKYYAIAVEIAKKRGAVAVLFNEAVWIAPEYDITEEACEQLNAEYKKRIEQSIIEDLCYKPDYQ